MSPSLPFNEPMNAIKNFTLFSLSLLEQIPFADSLTVYEVEVFVEENQRKIKQLNGKSNIEE